MFRLLDEVKFTVIRGNISEIKTVYAGSGTTKGVDADEADAATEENLDSVVRFAKELSARTGAVIAITGAIDVIADSAQAFAVYNGHPMMSKITGTGCMLTCVIACCCAANPEHTLEAVTAAVSAMGLCGELAYKKVEELDAGTASFRIHLIDFMSKMDDKLLSGGGKIESR